MQLQISKRPDDRVLLSEEDKQKAFLEFLETLRIFRPRENLNVWQWADKYRYLAKGVSAKSLEGKILYSSAEAPHQRKPQESFTDKNTQITVLVMASQIGGKTEMFNNAIGYHMDHAPRSAVVMYPQLDAAEKYSKKKFMPMVDATECLSKLVKPARSRDSGNTILVKDFQGGSVFFVGANSAASLRGASGAVLLGDEIDSNKPNSEGDSIELLFKRGESFPDCVKILASTPTIKGLSAIWEWFERSDQQYWFVPCVKCGLYQKLQWFQIVWPKGEPEKAELICSGCSAALNDSNRLDMYFNGEWRQTAPFSGIAGYHLNGIYCPWPHHKGFKNRLHQMAVEHDRAIQKGEYAKQVWVNTFKCETYEVETERVEAGAVSSRCEPYSIIPNEAGIVEAVVDVQKNRLECEIIAVGLGEESWGVEYKVLWGDTEQDEVWDRDLAGLLRKKYKRVDGKELPITATAIDMRHRGRKVRRFIKQSGIPRVYAVYGIGGASATPLLVTSRFSKRYLMEMHAVNGKIGKDTIFSRLKMDKPGPGFMHYPQGFGYTSEYFEQLTAEVLRRKTEKGGQTVEYYEKIRERNEALDVRVYFLALQDIFRLNMPAILKGLTRGGQSGETVSSPSQSTEKDAPRELTQLPHKPPVYMPRSRGFRNWK